MELNAQARACSLADRLPSTDCHQSTAPIDCPLICQPDHRSWALIANRCHQTAATIRSFAETIAEREIRVCAQGRARPTLAALYNWRYRQLGDLPNVVTDPVRAACSGPLSPLSGALSST